jgi:hypothetical protein
MFLEHAEVNQDVAVTILGHQESETAGRVKPFDPPRAMLTFRKHVFFWRDHWFADWSFLSRFGTQTLHG